MMVKFMLQKVVQCRMMLQCLCFICIYLRCSMSAIPKALNDSLKLFDWRFYLEINHDIADLGIKTEEQARDHYIRYGYYQQRWMNASLIPSNEGCMQAMDVIMTIPNYNIICPEIEILNERLKVFDWQFYLVASPDLKQLSVTTKEVS